MTSQQPPEGLSACPFCGAAAHTQPGIYGYALWVGCSNPACEMMPSSQFHSEAEGITAWNTRPQALAASPSVKGEDGWRAIESAPKGKKLLAGYRSAYGHWRTILATHYAAGTLEAADSLPDEFVDENGYAPAGWYEETETHEDLMPCDTTPTHWRPLPAPPLPLQEEENK